MEEFDYIIIGAGSAGCVLANRIVKTGKFKENGKDTIDGMKGYVQSTNDPDSRIARCFGYIISNPFKCRILSYSTVTDDADAILKNEITLRKGLYKMYVQSIKAHNLSLPDIDEKKHNWQKEHNERGDQEVLNWMLGGDPLREITHINELPRIYNTLRLDIEDNTAPPNPKIIHWTGPKGKDKIREMMK